MKIIFTIIIALATMLSCTRADRMQNDNTSTQNINVAAYRLFPTQNMWTFIKLNTRNGQMWQVQWGTESNYRFVNTLSDISRVNKDEEKNGRFFLYPTTNIYNFILLDQIDGRTWQVQWSTKAKDRLVDPIN